jgi:hypothetical protein
MKTSTTCPACRSSIDLLNVMRAPSPRHLACGACRAKLQVAGPANAIVIVLGAATVAAILALIFRFGVWTGVLPGIGALLVFEAVASLVVVNLGRLERR